MMHADNSNRDSKSSIADPGSVPPMPTVQWSQLNGFAAADVSGNFTLGWERKKDESCFVIARLPWWCNHIILRRYPPTESGWAEAWRELTDLDSKAAGRIRRRLAHLEEGRNAPRPERDRLRRELDQETLVLLERVVFLGGYSSFDGLVAEASYDLRFLGDRLGIFKPGELRPLGMLRYCDIANIQLEGPGVSTSVNPLIDPAMKVAASAFRIAQPGINQEIIAAGDSAISAILKRLGTRTDIKTVLFMQTSDSEFFFLNTKTDPAQLRIDLSRPLREIRSMKNSPTKDGYNFETSTIIGELYKAASLLESGLITRDEFDELKSRLISGT